MTSRSRLFAVALALLVLVGLAVWLLGPGVQPVDLGPAQQLVAHPASSVFVLGDGSGGWRVLDAAADADTDADVGAAAAVESAPAPEHRWHGSPVVSAAGRVFGLARREGIHEGPAQIADRLELEQLDGPAAEPFVLGLPDGPDGLDWRLLGVTGRRSLPVLLNPGRGEIWWLEQAEWRLLEDAEGAAHCAPDAPFALSDARAALAFRGAQGWEAWSLDSRPAVRRVARDCLGAPAHFTPDGAALVVDGAMMNIYRLELDDGRLGHMADGNLGHTPRVPWTAGVRGDPAMLVVPQFDPQGWLQIVQTNFSGGGRWQFNTGFEHHYLPAVSPAGRWMAYAQSPFDLDGEQPFEEDLYLFDFDHGTAPALALGRRAGGSPHQGPAWVARPAGAALLWVADGRAWRLDRPD